MHRSIMQGQCRDIISMIRCTTARVINQIYGRIINYADVHTEFPVHLIHRALHIEDRYMIYSIHDFIAEIKNCL